MTKKLMMMVVAAVAVAIGAWADTETVGGYTLHVDVPHYWRHSRNFDIICAVSEGGL